MFVLLSKTAILQKSLFALWKITIFLVRSLQKSTKIGFSNALKNYVEKKGLTTEFLEPFWASKILENRSQKRFKTKLVLRRYGNLVGLAGDQRDP